MASKTITITEDVYQLLKLLKKQDESFSELIERLMANQQKDPLKHFGIAKNLSDEVLDEFEEAIKEGKKKDATISSSTAPSSSPFVTRHHLRNVSFARVAFSLVQSIGFR